MTVLCHSWVGSDMDAPFTAFVRTVPALVLAPGERAHRGVHRKRSHADSPVPPKRLGTIPGAQWTRQPRGEAVIPCLCARPQVIVWEKWTEVGSQTQPTVTNWVECKHCGLRTKTRTLSHSDFPFFASLMAEWHLLVTGEPALDETQPRP